MSTRFFCPHCHSSMDPGLMEAAVDGANEYRICPECDEALLIVPLALPVLPLERSHVGVTEACYP